MKAKKCIACRKRFKPHPQVQSQKFCSQKICQRERRRQFQQNKRKNDPDYKDNQYRAQKAWSKRNPKYWQEYRKANPNYLERNRDLQKKRNQNRKDQLIAKMNPSKLKIPILSGFYRLVPASPSDIANINEWIVEIKFISTTYEVPDNCKERTRKT